MHFGQTYILKFQLNHAAVVVPVSTYINIVRSALLTNKCRIH